MTPVRSGGVGVLTPATLKDLKSNYNPFPGRTAISDNAGTRVSRFNEDPNGTHQDKEKLCRNQMEVMRRKQGTKQRL